MSNFWQSLKKPIIGLSPMDGITDFPFREIQSKIAKPDVIYTEFVSVEGFVRKPEKFKKQLTYSEKEHPIVAQVYGIVPNDFEKAVAKISQMGFDGIDINMGCPARTVTQRGGGGALIGNYLLAEKIINSCFLGIKQSGQSLPLSVKTRIGINEIVTNDWIKFLSSFPLSEITVHGRLLSSGQSGIVNWEEIGKAAKIAHENNILLLGNGGVKSLPEVKDKCLKYELDGILIGQGALGNPWLFLSRSPSKEEIKKTMIEHGEMIEKFHTDKGYPTAFKHFGWYLKGFENAKEIKLALYQTKNIKEAKKIIETLYPKA